MPIYEYRRPDGTKFEIVQSFSDPTLTVDPDTGVPVERVLHAPAVHFKGKGFYNTDYGTRKRQRENEASQASEKSESSGDSAKGDAPKSDSGKSDSARSDSGKSNSSKSESSTSSSDTTSGSSSKSESAKKPEPAAVKK